MDLDTILKLFKEKGPDVFQEQAPVFQRFDHSGGSTVIADNRPAGERPGYNPLLTISALRGAQANKEAEINRSKAYETSLTQEYSRPYEMGPLPSVEKLSSDPKWWTLYGQNPQKANQLHMKMTGTTFDEAYKGEQNKKQFLLKTFQEKFQRGDLRQTDLGEWEEQQTSSDPNDPTGKQIKQWVPLPAQFREAFDRIGGARALGLTDRREALESMPPDQRLRLTLKAQGMPEDKIESKIAEILTAGKARQPVGNPALAVPVAEGSYQAEGLLPKIRRGFETYTRGRRGLEADRLQSEGSEGTSFMDILSMIGNQTTNLIKQGITGGEVIPLSENSGRQESPTDLRREIDIMRLRKGLPRMDDNMWNDFLSGALRGNVTGEQTGTSRTLLR